MPVSLRVNGATHEIDAEPDTPLLYVLSNDLQLNGPRFGCGLAQCGTCTVHIDGVAVRSCVTPVASVEGAEIVTSDMLGTVENPHPLQKIFIEEQAFGCGYCSNGMFMEGLAFLNQNPDASRSDIVAAMDNNLCRCACHLRVVKSLVRFQEEMDA
jgi:nicotinate dehydrogenase subunit A